MKIKFIKNVSPLRYPGGKTRARKILFEIFKERFLQDNLEDNKISFNLSKYKTLYSPFFGGGSFEFFLQENLGLNIVGNDKFKPLICFWNMCKFNNGILCTRLQNSYFPATTEQCYEYRSQITKEMDSLSDEILGALFFTLNRCSFSGATLSGGFSQEACKKRFTQSSITRVQKLDLSQVDFHNQDFTKFLEQQSKMWNKEDSFLFLDPPYYLGKDSKLYGIKGDLHEDFQHETLCDFLNNKVDIDWMMTYNNHPKIKEMYKDYVIIEVEWKYGMTTKKESSEIVICSK
jgi:DNA adenine methylase